MPLITYREQRFKRKSEVIIGRAQELCADYQRQGYNMTLRQLYYQFVARGWLKNSDANYKALGQVINDARMAGRLDWDYISDRTRNLKGWRTYGDPSQPIEDAADTFKRNLWAESDQLHRPEVWVEKEALVDVVQRACGPLRVPHFACKGYVSQSEMWAAGQRMETHVNAGFIPVVIHLGDHDPSGIDMTRDIEQRLQLFVGQQVEVVRVALNMDQIEQYNPPPNPAKLTDSRAEEYVQRYGNESWELDALPPPVLDALIQEELERWVEREAWDAVAAKENVEREQMKTVARRWDDLNVNWRGITDLLDPDDFTSAWG